jgi:hypothetical protein
MTSQGDTPGGAFSKTDPTALTTDSIRREIASLRVLADANLQGEVKILEEKIASLFRMYEVGEKVRIEQKADVKQAVDDALQAVKEAYSAQMLASERAIAKSEAAVSKQLDQLQNTFNAGQDGQRRLVDELKERMGETNIRVANIEAMKVGAKDDRAGLYGTIAAVGGLLAIVAVAISIVVAITN